MCSFYNTHHRFLLQLGLTHIVTCVTLYEESHPPDEEEAKAGRWLVLRIADAATADLLSHLDEATDFVHSALASSSSKVWILLNRFNSRVSVCDLLASTRPVTWTPLPPPLFSPNNPPPLPLSLSISDQLSPSSPAPSP